MPLFTRLTFNENNWIIPSGHPWRVANQNNPNIPYENQHGFGHEEWLFNPRYNINGWQYGYIRGLRSVHEKIDRVYLYSVRKESKQNIVYYLGYLNNVEVLNGNWRQEHNDAAEVFNENFQLVIEEVEQTNGNAQILFDDPFVPVIRFRIDGNNILDQPQIIEGFPLRQYKRFQPYLITNEIVELFEIGINEINGINEFPFNFVPGKANQTERLNRYVSASSKAVIKIHSRIIDQLEKHLEGSYSVAEQTLSIEKTRFAFNIADIVTLENDGSISIYEVKTSPNLRKNIREAVAQLLDYSSHCSDTMVNKLVVVSPCGLDESGRQFLNSLNSIIKYRIVYMQYLENSSDLFITNE